MPHHYTTFPQFTQRPDYFSICVHWSEALQHNNLFRCRINKPIMLWMAHSFSKRAQCVASAKNEHHIGCRPHFGKRLWREMSFHLSILLLNFNISVLETQNEPAFSITGNEVVCLIMLYRVGESQRQGAGPVQSGNQREQPFPVLPSPL